MGFWPLSLFATPVSSFIEPVPPPGVDPLTGGCSIIAINPKWIPYIVGSLQQLCLQTTWDATGDELSLVLAQANNLLLAFNNLQSVDCGGMPPQLIDESEYQMAICEQLRFKNGKLQGLCCGVWTDIDGQASQGNVNPGQPGAGSPIPPPNGGQATYCGALGNGGQWLLPVNVSSGDTLLFEGLEGAWNDNREVIWNCPDGWVYALGACGQTLPHGSPDPLPTGLHMQIIAHIDGSWYDPLNLDFQGVPQVFTVPPGITNSVVLLQANIDDITKVQGSVSFCVTVKNNQIGTFTHTFDFTQSPGGFIVDNQYLNASGQWINGLGWSYTDFENNTGQWYRGAIILLPPVAPFDMTGISMVFDLTKGTFIDAFKYGVGIHTTPSADPVYELNPATSNGNNQVAGGPYSQPSVTSIKLIVSSDSDSSTPAGFTGSTLIKSLTVSGLGPDPF